MELSKVLIISPSGNFYGSEQVLSDYLGHTPYRYSVVVPANSLFLKLLQQGSSAHKIRQGNFKRLKFFYAWLFLKLLGSSYTTIYLNEAGHAKYLLWLAKIFRRTRFIIHIRIAEDTNAERWLPGIASNVQVITISKYMQSLFFKPGIQLYDPYNFTDRPLKQGAQHSAGQQFHIGVIGRISETKGLKILLDLLGFIGSHEITGFTFHIFGEPDNEAVQQGKHETLRAFKNVIFHGFVADKDSIYREIDCVMHLAKNEPLGRIFLESIEYNRPLIGFDAGGIGEIGNLTGLNELLIDAGSHDIVQQLVAVMIKVKADPGAFAAKCSAAKPRAAEIFSIDHYTSTLDHLFL